MYLNAHSYYSLRYGTISVSGLLETAKNQGYTSLVLSDINTTSACLDFIHKAPKYNIKPIVGVDFRNNEEQEFIAIAKNNQGFMDINEFLSGRLMHPKKETKKTIESEHVYIIVPYIRGKIYQLQVNEYIGIQRRDLSYVALNNIDLSKAVILETITFRNKRDFNIHRILRAIDKNTIVSHISLTDDFFSKQLFYDSKTIESWFSDFPQLIKNTQHILNTSTISFDFKVMHKSQNQKTFTGSKEKDVLLLKRLCNDGLKYRYPKLGTKIIDRIKKEIETICKMDFVSYFLINWDIVTYAKSKGYFYVGRGSGANSVVAYLLQITNVDPIELDLYFERFINAYRTTPPDFDIDFSWKDREDVTQYIFDRFPNVALVANFNTYQYRGAVRAIGKAFGLPKEEMDYLSKGNKPQNKLQELTLRYGSYIKDFPNNLSVHASGIVISEKPIYYFSATFLPPKNYPTLQFDMHIAEDAGLYKFDILSQRGLSKITETIQILKNSNPKNKDIDIHDIARFKTDSRIKTLLRNSDTVGCFYIESPAMRMLFTKLQVQDYLSLVAASSIIRPGVAQSGMMQEYIKRVKNPEKRKEAHPILLELMPETFGVMVYQEDVIKVAHYFAGLTLGEADKMRRGMSGKYQSREEFKAVKEKFFSNCKEKGYSNELTSEIWRQTESFAGYAFAKGHSASYAVESYQCLFLKAYYPLEFLVATINNYGGFYRTEIYIIEARKNGGEILLPCINYSYLSTSIYNTKIYLGFHLINSLEQKVAKDIVDERELNGLYIDFDDFLNRVTISLEQVTLLIQVNAFRFTNKNKRTLLWEAHLKLSKTKHTTDIKLFQIESKTFDIPKFKIQPQEDAFDQIELFGFPIYNPFNLANDEYRNSYTLADQVALYINRSITLKGYLVHIKSTKTSRGERMYFGSFLDENGNWIDTVHFPKSTPKYPFSGPGVYRISGTVIEEFNFYSINVYKVDRIPIIEDPRYVEKRDNDKNKIVTDNSRKNYWTKARQIQ